MKSKKSKLFLLGILFCLISIQLFYIHKINYFEPEFEANLVLKTNNSKNITITSPTGETSWERGTSQYITWETTGNIKNLDIELWKGGIWQESIATNTKNDQAKYWEISEVMIADKDYQIKIIDSENSSIFTYSEEFEIYQVPDLWVISPHSASSWKADSSELITWETSERIFVENVDIELYKGINFKKSIANNTPNDGIFLWFLPKTPKPGDQWNIKITDSENPSIYGFSEHFEIYSEKSIRIIYPRGFGHWGAPNDYILNWTWTGDIENVNLEMYLGSDLMYNVNQTSNNGTYLWSVPQDILPGMNWRIKIYASDYIHIYDITDNFQIFVIKTMTVLYPNSSVEWKLGGYYDIQWRATGNTTEVKIELYKNNEYFKTIAGRTPNDGRFLYQASGPIDYSAVYKIKVTAYEDDSIFDFSDQSIIFTSSPGMNRTMIIAIPSSIIGIIVVVSIPLGIKRARKRRSMKRKKLNNTT